MKVFYSVAVTMYHNGKRSMHISETRTAKTKPPIEAYTFDDRVVYVKWYDSYEEAEASMKGEM